MKIAVVDDSLMFRSAVGTALGEVDGFEIVGKFSNGIKIAEYVEAGNEVDVIIMDLEMPVLDGIEATKRIRMINSDVKIIMFSSVTVKGAEKTLEALKVGATDFIPKVESSGISESLELITRDLVPKIRALGGSSRVKEKVPISTKTPEHKVSPVQSASISDYMIRPDILCIGSSTGGPDALLKIFSDIKTVPSFPVLLTQHMPPMFTTKLADSLNSVTPMSVVEAKQSQLVEPGVCYLAPGDYHMLLKREKSQFFIELTQTEKVCHVRPSVDVMLNSVNEVFTGKILTLILTGMGSDGANACEQLAKKTHPILIQDEASSVVWGMPGAVAKKNLGAKSLALNDIGVFLNNVFGS